MLIDMLGQACPIPVITAKRELERGEVDYVEVLVDNIIAIQNLKKMADGLGYIFSYTESGDDYLATIKREGAVVKEEVVIANREVGDNLTVFIKSKEMGAGAPELGNILMKGFIFSLTELPKVPDVLIFLNSGVELSVEGSNTIDDLKTLEEKGTKIYSCGTCLNFYGLSEKLAVGEITDMYNITDLLSKADRLISL